MEDAKVTCPVCGGGQLEEFCELRDLPVFCNVLWPTAEEAVAAPRGDIRLALCRACGHVTNLDFDAELVRYSPSYENSLHFSPRFAAWAESLAHRLVDTYDLRGKTVVEIGSGKGDFLAMLCRIGGNRGLGYDPSYGGEADAEVDAADGAITFVAEPYPEGWDTLRADFVCSRHVLEHLERPAELVSALRSSLGDRTDTALYHEVPHGEHLLRERALWDVIYEHPQHFTPVALRHLFERAGFAVHALAGDFGGQYLTLEARPGEPAVSTPDLGDLPALAADFGADALAKINRWDDALAEAAEMGQRIALWGTGSKGVTFLNLVPHASGVAAVVDVNPRKHGRHVPGTGQRVVGPADLVADPPDRVLVMNPLYVDEVAALLDDLGVKADVESVDGDSP